MTNHKIFIDLDGVLTDFNYQVYLDLQDCPIEIDGLSWIPKYRESGCSYKQRQKDMDQIYKKLGGNNIFWNRTCFTWWENLPKTPDSKKILDLAEDAVGRDNCYILTSAGTSPESAKGKMKWILKNLPHYSKRVIITSAKHCCAGPKSLLIDDNDYKCNKFSTSGGHSFLVSRPTNSQYKISRPEMHANLLKALSDFVNIY